MTRTQSIAKYKEWLLTQKTLMIQARAELKGKIIACWCSPLKCHGDVLAEVANSGEFAYLEKESIIPQGKQTPTNKNISKQHHTEKSKQSTLSHSKSSNSPLVSPCPLIDIGVNFTHKSFRTSLDKLLDKSKSVNVNLFICTG
eukprot:UN29044